MRKTKNLAAMPNATIRLAVLNASVNQASNLKMTILPVKLASTSTNAMCHKIPTLVETSRIQSVKIPKAASSANATKATGTTKLKLDAWISTNA